MLSLVAALVVVILIGLYVKWSRVSRFWAARGVPHDRPHPLLGSLTFIQKENPGIWMRQMYDRFKSPYIGIWLLWRPALIINSPEIARRVLVKDFDVFRNRLLGTGIAKTDPIGGLNIFTVNDPVWSSVRRRLTPVFTSSKLKALHNLFATKSAELVRRIGNDLKENKPIEMRNLFADFSTDIIGISAFGVSSDATLEGDSPMRAITRDFMQYSLFRGLSWWSIFFFPEVARIFRLKMFPKTSEDYFRRVFKEIVARRGGYTDEAPMNDLVDALRRMKYENDKTEEAMDEDLVIAQAAIFLEGGFDTSASALSYITYELAFHPEVQEKVYNELLEAKQSRSNKELDGSTLGELVYLNCIIKETLRKYPSMGWLDRICDRDYVIDDNLTIPKGTNVYVNTTGMHHDAEYFPDPDKFDPDRFLPENEDSTRPYMPFGDGPRTCIGMRFAQRTIWYALAAILLQYELQSIPGAPRPDDVEADKRGLFFMPGEPIFIKFVPRN